MLRTDLQLKFVATLICVASRQILRHYDKLIIFPGKLNMCKPRADGKMGAINEPFSRKESIGRITFIIERCVQQLLA